MNDKRYQFIISTVNKAGELLLNASKLPFQTSTKNNDKRDIVTSIDILISRFIANEIEKSFPHETVYSEETPAADISSGTYWSIDPIDGTSCFSRNIPHFAIVLAFVEKGIPVVGAIYNPVTKELFSFQKGKGAFLNKKPVHVSKINELSQAHVFLRIGRNKDLWDWGINATKFLLGHANKTANFGSSALDLSFVGAGRIEACIYGNLTPIDAAAAIGFVREAGGLVVGENGADLNHFSRQNQIVIATNNAKILSELQEGIFRQ